MRDHRGPRRTRCQSFATTPASRMPASTGSSSRWSASSSPPGCGSRRATRPRRRTRRSISTVWSSPLLYERLTWPEVRRVAEEERVALIPVATLEDHGPHLPIDTDLRITAEICRRAATVADDETVLLPAIPHGYSPHHMDFPGPITIEWDTSRGTCSTSDARWRDTASRACSSSTATGRTRTSSRPRPGS
ncbi:MAG: hypothetical protein E6G42_06190 [Actinobacteria bacterium]|nr:MAG: hypothetical protein E6G42_06190 [Actinomycetota bacterium]